jgi:plastocyanin
VRGLRIAAIAAWIVLANPSGARALEGPVSVSIVDAPRPQEKWGFAPTTMTVPAGTWVTWSNTGGESHTVTAVDDSFDSGNLDPSEGFSWFFDTPGSYQYTCSYHSWMTATVVVTDPSSGG